MNAYLVGASGFGQNLNKREVGVVTENPILGDGMPALPSPYRNLGTRPWITPDRNVDNTPPSLQTPVHKRHIVLFHPSFLELACQKIVDPVALGHHHQTGSGLVQSVHNARSHRMGATDLAEVVKQCIDQGSGRVTGSRMNHHSGRLVDNYQFIIFMDNPQRDGLSNNIHRLGLRRCNGNRLAFSYRVVGFLKPTVDFHASRLDPPLNRTSACRLHAPGDKNIKPLSGFVLLDVQGNGFRHCWLETENDPETRNRESIRPER